MPISPQYANTITIRRGDDTDFLGSAIIIRFEFPKATVTEAQAADCKARFQISTVIKDLTMDAGTHTTLYWVYEANLTLTSTDTLKLTPGQQKGWLKITHDDPGVAGPGQAETSSTPIDFLVLQQEVKP
jgi:hypothetical protein